MTWHQHLRVLFPILGVYSLLASFGIEHQSLWEDEFLSLERVSSPIPIWQDGHGFLYFALLRGWMQLGTSTFVLRALSGLLGAVAVCLFYGLSTQVCHRRTAVIGTVLFATSPFLIWYSQEVRYITLVLATSLLSMIALRLIAVHERIWTWVAYGSVLLLTFFSFVATLVLALVHGLYLAVCPSRRRLLRKWAVCQVIVLAIFAWWLDNGTHYRQAIAARFNHEPRTEAIESSDLPSGVFNRVTPAVLPYTFYALSTGFSLGPSPRELHADRSLNPLMSHALLLGFLGVFYGGLVIAGLMMLWRQRELAAWLSLWLGVPIAGTFTLAVWLNVYYDVRYIAMVLPAYVLILAAGVSRFQRTGVQMVLLGMILLVHGAALTNYYFNPRYAREDARTAARYLEAAARPQDAILAVGTLSALPHYYRGKPPITALSNPIHPAQPVAEQVETLREPYNRLWLVEIRPWQIDPAGVLRTALQETHHLVAQQHFPGVDVYAYQVRK